MDEELVTHGMDQAPRAARSLAARSRYAGAITLLAAFGLVVAPATLHLSGFAAAEDVPRLEGGTGQESGSTLLRVARDSAARVKDKSMRVEMAIAGSVGPPLERSLNGFEKWTPEGRKILWVFDSPADLNGTKFLAWRQIDGRELLWVYFPAQRRVRQVTDQMRRERFQGSDLTYEDLATILYFDYEGTHSLIRKEPCGATTCAVVETELTPGRFAYRKLRTWLRLDVPLPHRIEFFGADEHDEVALKTVQILEVGTIDGIPTVLAMEARHARDASYTTARFSVVKYNTDLADATFSLASLSSAR